MTDPLIDKIRELRLDPMRCTSMARAFKNGSRPPSWPPATEQVVAEAESRLGFALPEFLRKLYLLVGNGGFGPGWGLAGLEGGYTLSEPWCADGSVVEASLRELAWNPDSKLLVVCDWGCLAASAIDCSTDSGEMVFIDEDDTRIGKASASGGGCRIGSTESKWEIGRASEFHMKSRNSNNGRR